VRVYLDHNATTPVHPAVADAMMEALRGCFGNPSSIHADGAEARARVERAREQVARLVSARPDEVTFTAGATEANNAVLYGVLAHGASRPRLVTTTIEHPSVDEPARLLEQRGCEVTRLPVDGGGMLAPEALAEALSSPATLVSAIWANNETGVIQPVEALAAAAVERGVPVHFDATQAVGKIPVDFARVPAAWLTASAHKFNGPKGVGFLVCRSGRELPPHVRGGPQERRRRGGTENLPGIVGLGVACEIAEIEFDERQREYARLRDRLWAGLREKVPGVRRNGSADAVLPGTLNVEFAATAGEILLEALDLEGISVSAGAACHSGSVEPSHVLLAMGRTAEQARGSLRLSVGLGVDDAQIDRVLAVLPDLAERVRSA
jgi:cysteine desulfurase